MSNPRIRVDGFNKNLEKKIFGEIVRSISTRKYIKSVVSDVGEYEVIQQGDTPILGYSNDEPFEKYKSVILFGDHTLSLYRPKAPFLLATDGLKILQSSVLKRDYLYYLTQNYIPTSQGYKRHFSILKKVSVKYSKNSTEQSAIGSLFSTLDDLVVNYKDNLSNYQSLKTTMLSKMFPKAGQTVPEIRLDGFEDEWKNGTIGEFGTFYYGKSAPKWSVTDEATTPCVRYGELYTKFATKIDEIYSYTSIPKEDLKLSTGNEVLVPRVGENPLDFANCSWLSLKDVAIGEMISVYNTENNPLFIAYYFNAKMKKEFAKRVEGGSVANLYYTYLENISISIPSVAEQQAIGVYFSNLDKLITSYQEKITQLETLKKKLLQDMFI